MMEFTYDGFVRWGFGFCNPNHAAAAICAILPFLWGWRRWAWVGWFISVVLLIPLSLTYSRTGFAVAAIEVLMWAVLSGRRKAAFAFVAVLATVAVAGGVAMRFHPDAAAMNRLLIWWSGLKLSAANPMGVGMGNSGLLVSAFMLEGIECRTLVNSHLTLLAEFGWIVGWLWIFFVLSGICTGTIKSRTRCSFVGLTISAFASSVFDWHVLFGIVDIHSHSNLLLSWGLFVLYVGCGFSLLLHSWTLRRILPVFSIAVLIVSLQLFAPKTDVPVVHDGFVTKKGTSMPFVFWDDAWSIRAVLSYLDDGYRIKITPGCTDVSSNVESVMLFGAVAESAFRFPLAEILIIDPPEFCTLPSNAKLKNLQ